MSRVDAIDVDKTGEQVDEIERRQLPRGKVLMVKCRFDQFPEVLGRRFVSDKRLGHGLPRSHERNHRVPCSSWCKAYSDENCEICADIIHAKAGDPLTTGVRS